MVWKAWIVWMHCPNTYVDTCWTFFITELNFLIMFQALVTKKYTESVGSPCVFKHRRIRISSCEFTSKRLHTWSSGLTLRKVSSGRNPTDQWSNQNAYQSGQGHDNLKRQNKFKHALKISDNWDHEHNNYNFWLLSARSRWCSRQRRRSVG